MLIPLPKLRAKHKLTDIELNVVFREHLIAIIKQLFEKEAKSKQKRREKSKGNDDQQVDQNRVPRKTFDKVTISRLGKLRQY